MANSSNRPVAAAKPNTISNAITNALVGSLLLLGAMTLSGCGRTPGERAVSGGLIGAGAGAALGAATGGSPLAGALIGGGVGAVGGAVTAPREYR
jgi:hypothetical protein